MTGTPAWLPDMLACPSDRGPLRSNGDMLECPTCHARYPATGGIPRVLPARLLASAKAQQDVYDTRNAQVSWDAQEAGFALQLIYREGLLLASLRELHIPLPVEGSRWVYVGGGEGTQCFVLSAYGGHHISLDVSASQLELGRWLADALVPRYLPRARPERVAFVQGDAETPFPLREASADVAYGLGVLNHLPPGQWPDHLERLCNLVVPGGTVFQVVPNLACEVYSTPVFTQQFSNPNSMQYWTQFMTADAVRDAFARAGLTSVRIATLWRVNHDMVVRRFYRVDRALSRLSRGRWPYHLSRSIQRWAAGAAERGTLPVKAWRFDVPRHLAIVGHRPKSRGATS